MECRTGADCASGVCNRDGTCEPGVGLPLPDGGLEDSGVLEPVDGGHDAGTSETDAGQPDAGMPAGCIPNRDGTIERDEVFFQAGLRATFKISGETTFATAGDGGVWWNFDTQLSGDASRLVETRPLTGAWYEADFPDAGYVSELGQGSTLLGVFSSDSTGLYLQGVVSPTDGASATNITYTPWVKVLQFPLTTGASWSTETIVDGSTMATPSATRRSAPACPSSVRSTRRPSTVDRSGAATTPFAPATPFDVLRVRTVLERYTRVYTLNPWYKLLTLRSYTWNTECFGTVATVTSKDNETSTEFTDAAEVRRLSR
ncbi:MAG: hypothetical protein DI536_21160 [Archangium gephyra]|uniref:Uncharacterized protein n=1 Tax=Archangium gephyra TaxID=48 RepID=A0A2W5TBR5_9BACT|nr:MAG: hypothetical protein DI536_21160 [Archangium gephyra]